MSWIKITEAANIPPREGRSVQIGREEIALFNLGDRFLAADFTRRVTFLDQCKFVLIGLATLVVVWRMPRFIRDLDRELSGEKL